MVEYNIVDVDAHFKESILTLAEYFEDPWRTEILNHSDPEHAASNFLPGKSGDRFIGGRITRDDVSYPGGEMTADEITTAKDNLNIDHMILISNVMLAFARVQGDDKRAEILANAYMDFMLEEVVDPDEGVYTLIVAPYQDPPAAVDLINRVGDEPGVVGVCMISAGAEPPLGNRQYDPIYEATAEVDLPLVFHAGGAGIDEYYIKGYEKLIETHTLGFLNANMSQLTSVVIQGIPEKFPSLDIVFQESGLYYIPALAQRLDAEYMKRPSEAPLLNKRPSEYMGEFYYGTQPLEHPEEEGHLKQVVDMIGGPERLLYASDYPHWDYDHPSSITDLSFLSNKDKKKILGENAKEVFCL